MVGHEARRVLCCARDAGETYELWIEPGEKSLVVGEDCQGPLAEAAFGETWHRSMVRVDMWRFDYEELLTSSDAPLCDLMDLLDAAGVSYEYQALGSSGVGTLRHSDGRNAA